MYIYESICNVYAALKNRLYMFNIFGVEAKSSIIVKTKDLCYNNVLGVKTKVWVKDLKGKQRRRPGR